MKTGWQHRPDNWPAGAQIACACVSIVPSITLVAARQNAWAIFAVTAGIGFWCWLGRKTRGFPLLFDLLGLQVFVVSIIVALLASVRLISTFFLHS